MGVKYVKDFSFPSSGGFHGDVQRYAKGGHVTKMPAKAKASAKDMPARAKPNAPAKGAPKMASKPAVGKRQGYDKGGQVPGREMDRLPTKRPPGRGKDLAPARPFKGKYEGYANGGPVDEILPGDGRGGLDVVTLPPMRPMDDDGGRNDFLRELLERDTQRMRGDAAQQMRDIDVMPRTGFMTPPTSAPVQSVSDFAPKLPVGVSPLPPEQPPVGALTPIPEEPFGRRPSGQQITPFNLWTQKSSMSPDRYEEYVQRMAPVSGMSVNEYRSYLNDAAARNAADTAYRQSPEGRAANAAFQQELKNRVGGLLTTTPSVPSASAPRMERPEPIGLASMMPGAPVSRPPLAGEPGFGTSDALRRQMAAVKSGMDLQGTRGVKGSPLAEAARRAAVQGRAGVREDMGRRPAAAPAPKASRNALLRALASRMKAPAPVSRVRSEVLPVNPAAIPAFKKGGEVSGKKIGKVMGEYKAGKLHSGSKKGPKVTSEKQAMAIALSEARKAGAKIPKKAEGGIFNDENMAYESKGPKTRYSAARSRRESKERAMERRALDKARHAEKYAPGMSLDMPDRKKHGGMPVHRRKPMYGGGKC